jgi:hypothetical protein
MEFRRVLQIIRSAHCTTTMVTKKAVWQVYSSSFLSRYVCKRNDTLTVFTTSYCSNKSDQSYCNIKLHHYEVEYSSIKSAMPAFPKIGVSNKQRSLKFLLVWFALQIHTYISHSICIYLNIYHTSDILIIIYYI